MATEYKVTGTATVYQVLAGTIFRHKGEIYEKLPRFGNARHLENLYDTHIPTMLEVEILEEVEKPKPKPKPAPKQEEEAEKPKTLPQKPTLRFAGGVPEPSGVTSTDG